MDFKILKYPTGHAVIPKHISSENINNRYKP